MRCLQIALTALGLLCLPATMPLVATVFHVVPGNLIQDAIDSSASGDTIVIHDGVYPETLVIDGKNDLHLVAAHETFNVGARPAGVGFNYLGNVVVDGSLTSGTPCLRIEDSHRVSVVGLTFYHCDGPGVLLLGGTAIRDTQLLAITVLNTTGPGVDIVNGLRSRVLSSTLQTSFTSSGVRVDGNDCVVADSVLTGSNDAGIEVLPSSSRTKLVNNELQANNTGIYDKGNRSRIEWNTATSNTGCQIKLGGTNADVIGNIGVTGSCVGGSGNEFAENQ